MPKWVYILIIIYVWWLVWIGYHDPRMLLFIEGGLVTGWVSGRFLAERDEKKREEEYRKIMDGLK